METTCFLVVWTKPFGAGPCPVPTSTPTTLTILLFCHSLWQVRKLLGQFHLNMFLTYFHIYFFFRKTGHTDAVWGLSYHGSRQQLLSCSADGTIRLWSPISNKASPLIKTYPLGNSEYGVPTSVDWVFDDPSHFVAAYRSGACVIYDVETGKQIMKMQTDSIQVRKGHYLDSDSN